MSSLMDAEPSMMSDDIQLMRAASQEVCELPLCITNQLRTQLLGLYNDGDKQNESWDYWQPNYFWFDLDFIK